MKDVSNSVRITRPSAYPKKKPSPYGVSKSRKQLSQQHQRQPQTPLHPAQAVVRKSPRGAKAQEALQRQRETQIHTLRREGIYLEEEYRDEIQEYMHAMERHTMSSIASMDQQPEIRWHMRPCLVDFLVEIHFTFRLRPETLYLTLNIIDRYVSRRIVYVKHYQLVGCAALWIAAKFEDAKERVPTVADLAQICRDTYDESAFIQMEGHVLTTIQWTLGHPTAEAWLRLLCVGPCMEELKVQHVARFVMEITLFYREFVEYPPSSIALGALTLARHVCGKSRRMLEETEECLAIVEHLDTRLAEHVNDLSETLVKKYSYAFYSKAATLVVQYYLEGGRFLRQPPLPLPMTPCLDNGLRSLGRYARDSNESHHAKRPVLWLPVVRRQGKLFVVAEDVLADACERSSHRPPHTCRPQDPGCKKFLSSHSDLQENVSTYHTSRSIGISPRKFVSALSTTYIIPCILSLAIVSRFLLISYIIIIKNTRLVARARWNSESGTTYGIALLVYLTTVYY
ncbi:hypothetical protein PHLGIDRAFT_17808 [Phlebiopsis gigantea 11061_1 CR5-6]|uniref:Uncharacterized protein n=1 Tax=Phlebiopsis gigantea (strain 11061_1 CR5-6) TaxID=745531 RepID=A0A0C3SDP2_PHLG1|nr:hypothetical protein PHLGIDRAFT_17808 [Phlebiopsis gigantea 11061_1 CR5-6]